MFDALMDVMKIVFGIITLLDITIHAYTSLYDFSSAWTKQCIKEIIYGNILGGHTNISKNTTHHYEIINIMKDKLYM